MSVPGLLGYFPDEPGLFTRSENVAVAICTPRLDDVFLGLIFFCVRHRRPSGGGVRGRTHAGCPSIVVDHAETAARFFQAPLGSCAHDLDCAAYRSLHATLDAD